MTQPPGFIPGKDKWPSYVEGQTYVRDRIGVIWLLVPEYDGGIATTATASGVTSVGLNVLRNLRGPLHILKFDQGMLDQFPTFHPEPELNKPKQEIVARTEHEARQMEA
jgi:hypothetical protein